MKSADLLGIILDKNKEIKFVRNNKHEVEVSINNKSTAYINIEPPDGISVGDHLESAIVGVLSFHIQKQLNKL